MTHNIRNVKVSRDEKAWEAEVRAEIPAEVLEKYRGESLKELQKTAKLDGFRPGHAPVERIVEVYGEPTIMRHAAEHAIQHELPELLAAEKLLIIDTPRVATESPEAGKALSFTARAPLAPTVELPDYKAIAKKVSATKEKVEVTDKEHSDALVHLRRERARIDRIEAGIEPQKAAEEIKALAEADLPELDDMFVQSLGYEGAAQFVEALRSNIKNEKELQAREKNRAAILDELVKKSTIHYPAMLHMYELDDMEARMKDDLQRMGTHFDAYLTQAKKSRDEIRAGWNEAADKRAKVRLILAEIGRQEKIEAEKAELDKEIMHAKEHYPNANDEALRMHISHAMRNEAVLNFLESTT